LAISAWKRCAACRFPPPRGDVPAVALQRPQHELFFDALHRLLPHGLLQLLEFLAGAGHVEVDLRQHAHDVDQVTLADDIPAGQDDRAFHHVLQLPHVAGPIVVQQQVQRARRELAGLQVIC
jgi:hypothetical protein